MILWLTSRAGIGATTKALLLGALRSKGINSTNMIFASLHAKVPGLDEYSAKKVPSRMVCDAAFHALGQFVTMLRPTLIVTNDEATLRVLTGRAYTLNQVRGSVYEYEGIPVLVFDDFKNLWGFAAPPHGKWVFGLDLAKMVRYATGHTKREPPFVFSVCRALGEVQSHCARARNATFIATDTETRGGYVTVVSYTYDCDGGLYTFCVPFFDPFADANEGSFWGRTDEEVAVRRELVALNASPVWKSIQNGMYDCAYFIHEGMPPSNWFLDPTNMMHALWCEAPKKLHHITSYFCDSYKYWKDEKKGMDEDNHGRTREDLQRYWEYNGRDCHYLWLATKELLGRLVLVPWALRNYNMTFPLSAGPCLAASLRGTRADLGRHTQIMGRLEGESVKGLEDLRHLTGEPEFNPNSGRNVGWFLYDFLGAKATRLQRKAGEEAPKGKGGRKKYGARSVDEKVLKLIKEQRNPIVNNFIDRLLRAKKPGTDISKYGDFKRLCLNGRMVSWLNPTATVTARFNSGSGQFWIGTNDQNIQKRLREFMVADPGYVLVEFDYSASDDRFIAYECEDPTKIATVEDKTKDIHCKHASIFFSIPYEKIHAGWKNDEEWVVGDPGGVRQNTKRVGHGRNFREGAETMFNTICANVGREAVVAVAKFLGRPNAEGLSDKQLIEVCQELIDKYDHPLRGMYKRLRPWQSEIVTTAQKNDSVASFAYGWTRKFFGDLENHRTQRELSSCYGQSGTAGNINRSLKEIWYTGVDDGESCLFLKQVHDALLFLIRKDQLHEKVGQIREIMERSCVIHGRTMNVPTEAKVGLTWGKKMLDYRKDLTYAEIVAFEAKHFGARYPVGTYRAQSFTAPVLISGIGDEEEVEEIPDGQEDEPLDEPELIETE